MIGPEREQIDDTAGDGVPRSVTRVVSVNEAETILRRAGWKEVVIRILLSPPGKPPREIGCGSATLIIKG